MSNASKRHMGRIAEVACVLCDALGRPGTPAEVHHIRDGAGMQQRASDWLTVPLCPACHRGPHGVHGDRRLLRQAKLGELDLLALTIERLNA
jgi:hypothetical protein